MHVLRLPVLIAAILTTVISGSKTVDANQTWRGLRLAPESRCSVYDASDYSYPQSVEVHVIESLRGIWSPYTGRTFSSRRNTDIEHIVARSEAHDSGLCATDRQTRRRFSSDLLNLTLASPAVNRNLKRARDASEWLPDQNRCWFADRIIHVRQKYQLTIDRREADALDLVLAGCSSLALVRKTEVAGKERVPDALAQWDSNNDGRITCAEAARHGISPVPHSHPAYRYMHDGDGDGVVCE